jgi:hypothetical protein
VREAVTDNASEPWDVQRADHGGLGLATLDSDRRPTHERRAGEHHRLDDAGLAQQLVESLKRQGIEAPLRSRLHAGLVRGQQVLS